MDLRTRLYNATLFGVKSGLENMRRACELLGNPEKRLRCIHVAGTNGKGTVCTKIAAGLKGDVGLFTSPHLIRFNERIKINGEEILDDDLDNLLASTFSILDSHRIPATFFEITTLIALQYFARWKVNYAVFETGLGGRFDATNVITPELSIITSISLEHTEILGDTIEAIAREKAGIIKPGIPVILGPSVPVEAPLMKRIVGPFRTHLEENEAIAKAALEYFGIHEVPDILPPCRFQIHHDEIPVIFDTAHNPDGLKHLFSALKDRLNLERFHIVCGFGPNKDHSNCFKEILPHAARITLTQAENGRCIAAKKLRSYIPDTIPCDIYPNPQIAAQEAFEKAKQNREPLLVCGSFFIMEGALNYGCESKQMA